MKFLSTVFFVLLFFLTQFEGISQNEIDSLEILLSKTTDDSSKIDILLDLSWVNRRINPVNSIDKAFLALKLSENCSCSEKSLKSLSFIGVALRSAGYYDEALKYFKETLSLAQKKDIRKELGFAHINIGYTHLLKKKYKLAEELLLKASHIADSLNDIQLQDYSYTYLVYLYIEIEKFGDALKWSNKVEHIKIQRKMETRLAAFYMIKGNIFFELKKHTESLNSYKKGLTVIHPDTLAIYRIYSKIAILYLEQNNLKLSLEYAQNAYNIISNQSSSGFRAMDFTYLKIELCTTLSKIYKKNKDYKKLAYYQNRMLLEKDKIISNKTIQEIVNADTHKRLLKKEQENIMLVVENKEREKVLRKRNQLALGGIIIFIFLAVLSYFLYRERQKLKQVNKLLIKQKEELKESNATKDKFFSIVAHDLKNPFNALFGLIDVMKENLENNETENTETVLEYMYETVTASYSLLENLLNWSQSQQEKIKYRPKKIKLLELIQRVIKLLNSNAKEKSIELEVEVSENDIFYADENMIFTVLRNLVSNAIKFSYKNGVIKITSKLESGKLKILIIDNGLGILQQNVVKMFQISESISTHGTAGEKGTGIGLPLCKEFVEKNKGEIGVESESGTGSTFWFTLPINPV